MRINWKVRLRNPLFVLQIVAAVSMPVLAYMGLTVQDLTTWSKVGNVLLQAVSNPYILGLVAISVFNAVQDPTTPGVKDSSQVMRYEIPKKGDEEDGKF